MKTLIELYDDRPIENVLATEVFRPERTVFLCSSSDARNENVKKTLADYFRHCGLCPELVFRETAMYDSENVAETLRETVKQYPDCVVDITGGTDAALFSAGTVCVAQDIPAFTYSRKQNCFYSIHKAPFDGEFPCTVKHRVEDCFRMAGGSLQKGRVDNAVLSRYLGKVDSFFSLYLKYRSSWTQAVSFIQKASQSALREKNSLAVSTSLSLRGERGRKIEAPQALLRSLAGIGFIKDLEMHDNALSFRFKDQQIRTWLRDVGSVLELYTYKACLDTGLFYDVRTSAVVDWEGSHKRDNVTNEIDVMAMYGILPVFISCKTCPVSTEALNELAILRARFGGKGAKAAIVTSQLCGSITRHRAQELGIDVIDLDDLKKGRIREHLLSLVRPE